MLNIYCVVFSTVLINANTSLLFPFFSFLILLIRSRIAMELLGDEYAHMEQNRLVAPTTALIFISFSASYLAKFLYKNQQDTLAKVECISPSIFLVKNF